MLLIKEYRLLSRLWYSFFLISFLACFYQWWGLGQTTVFAEVIAATFDMAKLSVDIAIGLIGLMCFWLGLFKIAEESGLIRLLARGLSPLFTRLMPEVPKGHQAIGSITMNLAANMLGLDNAATPMGLKAMADLQSLNPEKTTASNPQILFLVLNTSSITLLPLTIFLYRAQQGAAEPTAVFLPIILATTASTLAGLLAVAWIQKIKLLDPVVLAYFMGLALMISSLLYFLQVQSPAEMQSASNLLGNLILFFIIMLILSFGLYKKVPLYDRFVEGAKEGVSVCVTIIPYLVAMLVAIGVLRASGALDVLVAALTFIVKGLGLNSEFVAALPTALMKPFSGSGARAMMIETMTNYGVDSFPALIAAAIQGSTETTFYVLAVYFGSVGIQNVRHAVFCGLLADVVGIVTAILVGYWFFYPG